MYTEYEINMFKLVMYHYEKTWEKNSEEYWVYRDQLSSKEKIIILDNLDFVGNNRSKYTKRKKKILVNN
jgi:hypothetical protein